MSSKDKKNEIYNKIKNLKSKMTNYSKNSIKFSDGILRDRSNDGRLNKSIDNSRNNNAKNEVESKNFLSTISDLKKKWNDVSKKGVSSNIIGADYDIQNNYADQVAMTEDDYMNQISYSRVNEIRNKYNMKQGD